MLLDFKLDQGSTFLKKIVLKTKNELGVEEIQDPAGLLWRMQVRKSYSEAGKIVDMTNANAKIIINTGANPEDKYLILKIAAEDTKDFPSGNWVYDLECEDGDGVVKKVLKGKFVIYPEVTK